MRFCGTSFPIRCITTSGRLKAKSHPSPEKVKMNSFFVFILNSHPDCIQAVYGVFQKYPVWQTGHYTGFLGFQPPLFHDPYDCQANGVFMGLSGSGAAGTGKRWAGIDGWDAGPGREFLFFLFRGCCLIQKRTLSKKGQTSTTIRTRDFFHINSSLY